jgi:hypothetical protein
MALDLSEMEEIVCPDCKKPLFAIPNQDNPKRYSFQGCHCEYKMVFALPRFILFGIEGGQMFLYNKKESSKQPRRLPAFRREYE